LRFYNILTCGTDGSEGARTAAAIKLSKCGFVIKISADGPITLYRDGHEIIEV